MSPFLRRKKRRLHYGLIWLPERNATRRLRDEQIRRLEQILRRRYASVENRDNRQRGFFTRQRGDAPALALYIAAEYGDGVWYATELAEEDNTDCGWLLIIRDGLVQPGTDIILPRGMLNLLLSQPGGSVCAGLPVVEITPQWINQLNEKYFLTQAARIRQRNKNIVLTAAIFIALLPLLYLLWTRLN